MTTHRLDAAADTVHWGFFDASLKPLITVESGDVVTISTVSGAPAAILVPRIQFGPRSRQTAYARLESTSVKVPQRLNGTLRQSSPDRSPCAALTAGRRCSKCASGRSRPMYNWALQPRPPARADALPDDFDRGAAQPTSRATAHAWRQNAAGPRNWPASRVYGEHGQIAPPADWGPVASRATSRRSRGALD